MRTNFGVEREKLTTQYRFALEQALAKANFITTSELVVLQAFILFLVLVRRHDDTRFCWTLTGLAVRIGQSMGLHRDGLLLPGLTPLEIEIRRRVFWALCILDLRSAEDQGTDLTIGDKTFDTELPLNINDSDISDQSTEMPRSRQGATDMTFSLIRYEVCAAARRLYVVSANSTVQCPRDAAISLEERETMVRSIYEDVEEKYFKDASTSCNAQLWTAANIARVIVAKMTLVIYQPVLFPGPDGQILSEEIRERIFTAATEIFEYNHQLNSDLRSRQWKWLFQTYTQWHAVAYVLMEVARRPWSAGTERAWTALNSVFASPSPHDLDRIAGHQSMWLPLKRIYLKAKKHREAEIARLKADPDAAQALELQERSKAPVPLSFAAMPGSVKSAIALERWRKLVNAPPLPPELRNQQPQHFASAAQAAQESGAGVAKTSGGQLPNKNLNMNGGAPASMPNLQDPRIMGLVQSTMSEPHFSPENIWPMAFSPEFQDIARAANGISGFPFISGNGDIPRQDATLANFANNNNSSSATVSTATNTNTRMPQSTPLLDALKIEGNLPPWMWTDTSGSNSAFATTPTPGSSGPLSATTPAAQGSFGLPLAGGMGEGLQPADDIDIDMNEDFNWADWGQTLMESGGNMGGVWSAHGI